MQLGERVCVTVKRLRPPKLSLPWQESGPGDHHRSRKNTAVQGWVVLRGPKLQVWREGGNHLASITLAGHCLLWAPLFNQTMSLPQPGTRQRSFSGFQPILLSL